VITLPDELPQGPMVKAICAEQQEDNLKNVDIEFPWASLSVITGVRERQIFSFTILYSRS